MQVVTLAGVAGIALVKDVRKCSPRLPLGEQATLRISKGGRVGVLANGGEFLQGANVAPDGGGGVYRVAAIRFSQYLTASSICAFSFG